MYTEYLRNSQNSIGKKESNLKIGKDMNRNFTEDDVQAVGK